MSDIVSRRRWLGLTPGWLVLALLAVEGFLFLSERFGWFAFNTHKGWTVLIDLASMGAAVLLMLLWLLASVAFRRQFQFSLRSLLALTAAVALACSWLAVEMKRAKQQREAVDAIVKLKLWGFVGYDYAMNPYGAQPHGPLWLRALLDEDFFNDVVEVSVYDPQKYSPPPTEAEQELNAVLQHLKLLPCLEELDLTKTPVNDADLNRIVEWLPKLRMLCLARTQVTDVGLERIKELTQLHSLHLQGTLVADAGLGHLKALTQLQVLCLNGTKVTDPGLENLKGLTQLQFLDLGNTKVTSAGLEHLKGLSQLQSLNLWSTQVTDRGMLYIKGLVQLRGLDLGQTRVTSAGLEHLKGLSQLQSLNLSLTQVTDADLEHLKRLTQLQSVHLFGTKVTDEGVKELQQALPDCQILH